MYSMGWGATYYIDPTCATPGDGTSSICADGATDPFDQWSDITWTSGNTYLQKKGTTAREMVTIGASGADASHLITLGSYGTGDNPILSGAAIITNVSFTLTAGQTYTYESTYTLITYGTAMVWENGVRLTVQTSIATVEATAGTFWISGGKVYVHSSDNSSVITNGKVYEVPKVTENFWDNGNSYIWLENFETIRTSGNDANTVGGIKLTGSYNTISNVKSHDHRRHSLIFYTGATNNLATGCETYDSWSTSPLTFFGAGTTLNIFEFGKTHDATAYGAAYMHGGATINTVRTSEIYNSASNVLSLAVDAHSNIITKCKIYGTAVKGLYIGGLSNEISYNQIIATSWTDIPMYLLTDGGTLIYNNTMIGGASGFYFINIASGTGVKVKNNISKGADRFIYVANGAQTDFESDYNIVNGYITRYGNWLGATKATLAIWNAASGQDAHSSEADPLFRSSTDFHLQSSSPAINAGVDVGLTSDFEGKSISWVGAPCIGAYEYHGQTWRMEPGPSGDTGGPIIDDR